MDKNPNKLIFSEKWNNAFSIYVEYTRDIGGIYELGIYSSINYLSQIKRFIKYLGLKEISEVEFSDLDNYITDLKRRKNKKSYISFCVASIKSGFDLWHELDIISENPFIKFKLPSRKRKGKRKLRDDVTDKSLTAQTLLTIFETIESSEGIWDIKYKERDWLLLSLAYVTGLRVLEVSNIYINKINFDEKYLKVIRKGGEEEVVLITDLLKIPYKKKEIIPDIIEKMKHYIESNDLQPEDRLFDIHEKAMWFRVKKWATQAGFDKKISTHFLRHTFGTHLGALNVSAPALKTLMNHKRIETTEKYIQIPTSDSGGVLKGLGLYSGNLKEGSKIQVKDENKDVKLD